MPEVVAFASVAGHCFINFFELGVLVVGKYCVAQGAVSDMVARVDVVVEDVIEVATKVVKVFVCEVSVGTEEYKSLNTETEMGQRSLLNAHVQWEETLHHPPYGGGGVPGAP